MSQQDLGYFEDSSLADPNLKGWDGAFSDLPPGEYAFEVTEGERKPTSKGEARLALKVKCITPGEFEGQSMFHGFMLAGAKDTWKKRLVHFLGAVGIKIDEKGRFDMNKIIGSKFIGTVTVGTYDEIDAVSGAKQEKKSTNIAQERPMETAKEKPVKGPATTAQVAAAAKNGAVAQPGVSL